MMRVKYVGPNSGVFGAWGSCEFGQTVDVPDDIGANLVEQGAFQEVKSKADPAAVKSEED